MQRGLGGLPHERLHQEVRSMHDDSLSIQDKQPKKIKFLKKAYSDWSLELKALLLFDQRK
jgi:hypothetical protein